MFENHDVSLKLMELLIKEPAGANLATFLSGHEFTQYAKKKGIFGDFSLSLGLNYSLLSTPEHCHALQQIITRLKQLLPEKPTMVQLFISADRLNERTLFVNYSQLLATAINQPTVEVSQYIQREFQAFTKLSDENNLILLQKLLLNAIDFNEEALFLYLLDNAPSPKDLAQSLWQWMSDHPRYQDKLVRKTVFLEMLLVLGVEIKQEDLLTNTSPDDLYLPRLEQTLSFCQRFNTLAPQIFETTSALSMAEIKTSLKQHMDLFGIIDAVKKPRGLNRAWSSIKNYKGKALTTLMKRYAELDQASLSQFIRLSRERSCYRKKLKDLPCEFTEIGNAATNINNEKDPAKGPGFFQTPSPAAASSSEDSSLDVTSYQDGCCLYH